MLDCKFLRDNLESVEARLKSRGEAVDLNGFRMLDTRRRELLQQSEELKALRNRVSDEISRIKDKSQAQDRIAEMREVGGRIKGLDEELNGVEEAFEQFLLTVPNIPYAAVPIGSSEADNVEVRKWGEIPVFSFDPKPHWEIGETLDILDFERGAKLTGARFTLYKGAGADWLNAREAGISIQVSLSGPDDLGLVRIALPSPDPALALRELARQLSLPEPVLHGGSVEDLYGAERALLEGNSVIPLFHLQVANAVGARVHGWAPYELGFGNLADLWVQPGSAEARLEDSR